MPGPISPVAAVIPGPRLLAAARALTGLSQIDLAIAAGVHRTVVGRYEAGATRMRADLLEQVVAVLRDHGVAFLGPNREWDGGVIMLPRRAPPDEA